MRRRLPRLLLIPVALAVVVAGLPGAPAVAAPDASWFWEWSDGSRDRHRPVSEQRFGTWERIPALTVASSPGRPGVRVHLQVRQGNAWRTEDEAVTDARGRAHLRVNPYCRDGAWCDETVTYRIRAGGATASLTVAFTGRPGPP